MENVIKELATTAYSPPERTKALQNMSYSYLKARVKDLEQENSRLMRELEQVKHERDEMFDILSDERNCADCKYLERSQGEEPCRTCLKNTNTKVNWQWRGVKE